jgi:hypothetical protein
MGFSNSPAATSRVNAQKDSSRMSSQAQTIHASDSRPHTSAAVTYLSLYNRMVHAVHKVKQKNLKIPAFQDSRKAPRLLRRPVASLLWPLT